jgi:hypothetical protein
LLFAGEEKLVHKGALMRYPSSPQLTDILTHRLYSYSSSASRLESNLTGRKVTFARKNRVCSSLQSPIKFDVGHIVRLLTVFTNPSSCVIRLVPPWISCGSLQVWVFLQNPSLPTQSTVTFLFFSFHPMMMIQDDDLRTVDWEEARPYTIHHVMVMVIPLHQHDTLSGCQVYPALSAVAPSWVRERVYVYIPQEISRDDMDHSIISPGYMCWSPSSAHRIGRLSTTITALRPAFFFNIRQTRSSCVWNTIHSLTLHPQSRTLAAAPSGGRSITVTVKDISKESSGLVIAVAALAPPRLLDLVELHNNSLSYNTFVFGDHSCTAVVSSDSGFT